MAHGTYYHVAPYYTCGSPAQVDEETARRVAAQERDAHERDVMGYTGPNVQAAAERRGLNQIVYSTHEIQNAMYVEDLLTGAEYVVPLKHWGRQGSGLAAQSASWHQREDIAQFQRDPENGLTPYDRAGKRYVSPPAYTDIAP